MNRQMDISYGSEIIELLKNDYSIIKISFISKRSKDILKLN